MLDPIVHALRTVAQALKALHPRHLEAAAGEIGSPVWLIACSGGLDSSVLLHAAVQVFGPGAVVLAHVDHGLQEASSEWAQHCAKLAARLDVRFLAERLDPYPGTGNMEQWAREQRYRALVRMARLAGAHAMLTAHHQDDQFETVLMALARGAGPDGLSGMAQSTLRWGVPLLRPFLALDRSQLQVWAERHALHWIDDPMNAWIHPRRNVVRQRVVPLLDQTLPGVRHHLAQSVQLLREAHQRVAEQARLDLQAACSQPEALHALHCGALEALDDVRQRAVLRAWLAQIGLRMPTRARLAEMQSQWLIDRAVHSEIQHEGWRLTRQGPRLLAWPQALHPLVLQEGQVLLLSDWQDRSGHWALALPDGSSLIAEPQLGGVCPDWLRRTSFSLRRPCARMSLRLQVEVQGRMLRKRWQDVGMPVSVRGACGLVLAQGQPFWIQPDGLIAGDWPRASQGLKIHWQTHAQDPRVLQDLGAR